MTVFPGGRSTDTVVILLSGHHRRAYNQTQDAELKEVPLQDGICEACRAEHFPETVKR